MCRIAVGIIIIIIIIICELFRSSVRWFSFHYSLSDSKFPQVYGNLLTILSNLKTAVV